MNINGLKSFASGLIWIGIGAFICIEGYKVIPSFFSEFSFAFLGGIAALMYGSLLLLNGFITTANSTSKA
ncbi:hypothetical protein [Alteromonas gracilis]|uniref:hypothetical protein n=1 Tax=Alteromonas gracilis TaxID=1479524 RepID=UPI0037350041